MKKLLFVFILLSVPLLLFAQKKVIDRIVAVVDNEIILESELNLQLLQYAAREKIDPKNPDLRKMILENLIDNQLILAQAKLDSIVVTDEEVAQSTEDQIKNLISTYGSEERLVQAANMSINRMKIEFKDDMKKRLLIDRAKASKFGSIRISRREVEEFFQNFKDSLPPVPDEAEIYHILIYPKPNTQVIQKTFKFAQKILDSIKAGADFSVMAKRYSEHTSGAQGGDLPWVKRGTFVKEFEEAAFALQNGQVSNVVQSPLGLHIIKLIDRRGESILVKQILFKINKTESDDAATIEFLKGLKERVLKGEKFIDLAKKFSEDPTTKDFGGFLGKIAISELPENYLALVKNMKQGDISDPEKIKLGTNYGFHIVYMDKKIPGHKMTLETDMLRIETIAKNFKQSNELKNWLDEIKKNVYVDLRI